MSKRSVSIEPMRFSASWYEMPDVSSKLEMCDNDIKSNYFGNPLETMTVTKNNREQNYNQELRFAELIQNSIAANSTEIGLEHYKTEIYGESILHMWDNGSGINEHRVMSFKNRGEGSDVHRGDNDVGRYGKGSNTCLSEECMFALILNSSMNEDKQQIGNIFVAKKIGLNYTPMICVTMGSSGTWVLDRNTPSKYEVGRVLEQFTPFGGVTDVVSLMNMTFACGETGVHMFMVGAQQVTDIDKESIVQYWRYGCCMPGVNFSMFGQEFSPMDISGTLSETDTRLVDVDGVGQVKVLTGKITDEYVGAVSGTTNSKVRSDNPVTVYVAGQRAHIPSNDIFKFKRMRELFDQRLAAKCANRYVQARNIAVVVYLPAKCSQILNSFKTGLRKNSTIAKRLFRRVAEMVDERMITIMGSYEHIDDFFDYYRTWVHPDDKKLQWSARRNIEPKINSSTNSESEDNDGNIEPKINSNTNSESEDSDGNIESESTAGDHSDFEDDGGVEILRRKRSYEQTPVVVTHTGKGENSTAYLESQARKVRRQFEFVRGQLEIDADMIQDVSLRNFFLSHKV